MPEQTTQDTEANTEPLKEEALIKGGPGNEEAADPPPAAPVDVLVIPGIGVGPTVEVPVGPLADQDLAVRVRHGAAEVVAGRDGELHLVAHAVGGLAGRDVDLELGELVLLETKQPG